MSFRYLQAGVSFDNRWSFAVVASLRTLVAPSEGKPNVIRQHHIALASGGHRRAQVAGKPNSSLGRCGRCWRQMTGETGVQPKVVRSQPDTVAGAGVMADLLVEVG